MKARSLIGEMRMGFVAILLAGVAGSASARAQTQTPGQGQPVAPQMGNTYIGPYANPYMNPGMMPGVNPYMMATPNDPRVGMLTFLYMQKAGGGIGSGRLSNGAAFRDRTPPAGVRPAAFMPRSVATPTSGAERYFGRLPDRGAPAADYFHRSTPSRRR